MWLLSNIPSVNYPFPNTPYSLTSHPSPNLNLYSLHSPPFLHFTHVLLSYRIVEPRLRPISGCLHVPREEVALCWCTGPEDATAPKPASLSSSTETEMRGSKGKECCGQIFISKKNNLQT